jgi:uncharacterized protein (DUF1501 family)
MNRRDLLTYMGAAGAAGLLARTVGSPGSVAYAAGPSTPPRRLIMVMAQGGWDTTWALDPKVQSARCDVPLGARRMFGNLDVFDHVSRPNVTNFFTRHADKSAIVRGISVSSVSHSECVKRMATGTRSERNPDMGAIVATDNGNALPLPYLILGDTAFAGEYAVSAGRVGATNQIVGLLGAPTNAAEDAILSSYANATVNRVQATRGATGYNRRRLSDFTTAIERGKQLVPVRAGFGAAGRTLTLSNQVDLAVDAIAGGISQAVMVNTRLGWDTHDMIDDQAGFHETTFGALTTLVDELSTRPGRDAGTKMIDDTIVVCFSEFSRTPRLNANNGKDHWPVTSAVVIGGGIRGGRAYGSTNNGIEAETINFATGAKSATGMTLMSNHFVAGVLTACGVDPIAHLGATEVFDAFVK